MDDYSDDDLDHLPDHVLQELEQNAILSTQAPQQRRAAIAIAKEAAQPTAQDQSYDAFDSEDEDLDAPVLVNPNPALVSAGTRLYAQGQPPTRSIQPTNPPRWNAQPSQANPRGFVPRPQNGPALSSQLFQAPLLTQARQAPSQFPRAFAPPPPRYAPSQSQAINAHPNAIAALEQRLRALEHELNMSKGEVSILRSNSTKAQQAHEAELARVKAQNAEQLARQQRIVEAATLKEKTATTELQFMQRDMQEVTSRARRKDTGDGAGGAGGATTPRKTGRNWGMADGFEGVDLVPSPSKALGRTKSGPAALAISERTPTKGKRKRPAADSPILPLETHAPDVEMLDNDPACSTGVQGAAGGSANTPAPLLPFDFLPLILDHASSHGQPPTFDLFSQYFFPSDPNTSFSSIIFQSLPVRNDSQSPNKLLVDFSLLVINLWGRCVEEGLFAPIGELVSLLTFALQLHTVSVAPKLLDKLLAVAQDTLHVIAKARMQVEDGDLSKDPDYQALQASINSTKIVSLLHMSALACTTCTETDDDGVHPRVGFWRRLSLDIACLMLSARQLLHDVVGMLDLLCTSVFPETIGPIVQDKAPESVARAILNNVSILLTNPPVAARSPTQKHAVSSAALRTLMAFTASTFGIHQVAAHNGVVSRLVVALSEAVNDLYDQDISPEVLGYSSKGGNRRRGNANDPLSVSEMSTDVSGLCRVISQATLLLHTLVTDPRTSGLIDINSKIPSSHGGSNRYQIALCRLTCAEEDLVLEAGIDTQTANRANELLELLLTPDEAKIIGEAFVSGG